MATTDARDERQPARVEPKEWEWHRLCGGHDELASESHTQNVTTKKQFDPLRTWKIGMSSSSSQTRMRSVHWNMEIKEENGMAYAAYTFAINKKIQICMTVEHCDLVFWLLYASTAKRLKMKTEFPFTCFQLCTILFTIFFLQTRTHFYDCIDHSL